MEGVFLKNLKRINNSKGDILHALKKSESTYKGFGEAYFSLVNYDQIKGWKKHTKMTMNLIVPVGEIKFVLYDNRDNKIKPIFSEFIIGESNYKRLTIPPNVFVSFKGLDKKMNLLLNIADLEHDPDEAINIELEKINYNW
jgi:dTDP-4-dehydrorhamnose 3,5-epimerase